MTPVRVGFDRRYGYLFPFDPTRFCPVHPETSP